MAKASASFSYVQNEAGNNTQARPASMLQVLLQEVAWDEASRGRKRQARLRAMSQHEGIGDLEHEPLFCAETALKVAVAVVAGMG